MVCTPRSSSPHMCQNYKPGERSWQTFCMSLFKKHMNSEPILGRAKAFDQVMSVGLYFFLYFHVDLVSVLTCVQIGTHHAPDWDSPAPTHIWKISGASTRWLSGMEVSGNLLCLKMIGKTAAVWRNNEHQRNLSNSLLLLLCVCWDSKACQPASPAILLWSLSLASGGLWWGIMLITSALLIMGSLMALMLGFILFFIEALSGGCLPHRLLSEARPFPLNHGSVKAGRLRTP